MPTSASSRQSKASALGKALNDWWASECFDWDSAVLGAQEDSDLWDNMPTVDSKAIARSSPVFEKSLGAKLDVKLIRKGGYQSIEDAIAHLVPLMIQAKEGNAA